MTDWRSFHDNVNFILTDLSSNFRLYMSRAKEFVRCTHEGSQDILSGAVPRFYVNGVSRTYILSDCQLYLLRGRSQISRRGGEVYGPPQQGASKARKHFCFWRESLCLSPRNACVNAAFVSKQTVKHQHDGTCVALQLLWVLVLRLCSWKLSTVWLHCFIKASCEFKCDSKHPAFALFGDFVWYCCRCV